MKSDDNKHNRGRPTIQEQIDIDRKLRPYFTLGIGAPVVSVQTGMDVKTVRKRFKQWCREIVQSESKEFLERSKEAKERKIIAFDYLILSEQKQIDKVDEKIKQLDESGNFKDLEKYLRLRDKQTKRLAELTFIKFDTVSYPTYDVYVDLNKKIGDDT